MVRKVTKAVFPVAGLGTRFLPATKSIPKEIMTLVDRPLIQYAIDEARAAGIKEFIFVTSRGKGALEDYFDSAPELEHALRKKGKDALLDELKSTTMDSGAIAYIRQQKALGLGHAVLCARPLVGDQPFVVALGDSIIGINAQSNIVARMVDRFEADGADVVVAFENVPREEVVRYGIARPADGEPGDVFELADVIEKPSIDEAPSQLAVAARYVLSPRIFDALASTEPGKGGEIQLTDAIRRVLADGGRGVGIRLKSSERRFDIGNFGSYFRAFTEFALADPRYGEELRAFVRQRVEPAGDGDAGCS